MPSIDFIVSTELSTSIRARQICSMFDVPPEEKCQRQWKGQLPIEERDWNIGLIVGPSGCGKSSIMKQVWGEEQNFEWNSQSMIDDFDDSLNVEDITKVCAAVGFNTIPAWLRPFRVLSNGEQFRADLARRLCEVQDPVVIDEFTSVVDRQVARIGSHAVQKWARRSNRQFVAVTCHYDVIDWLQPDWILEPSTMKFGWRSLQQRPKIKAEIRKIKYKWWEVFAPYHYISQKLHSAATCFGLFIENNSEPVAFIATLHRPHPKVHDVIGVSRVVVLPDWQGLGLAFILMEKIGAAYSAIGKRLHIYPAHPPFIRSCNKSAAWILVKSQNEIQNRTQGSGTYGFGGRPCAVFRYIGKPLPLETAENILEVRRSEIQKRHAKLTLRRKKNSLKRKKRHN